MVKGFLNSKSTSKAKSRRRAMIDDPLVVSSRSSTSSAIAAGGGGGASGSLTVQVCVPAAAGAVTGASGDGNGDKAPWYLRHRQAGGESDASRARKSKGTGDDLHNDIPFKKRRELAVQKARVVARGVGDTTWVGNDGDTDFLRHHGMVNETVTELVICDSNLFLNSHGEDSCAREPEALWG